MSCPRIEVDLDKIRRNTQTIAGRLGPRGIGVTGVTKAVCGHPAIAQAILDGGAVGLADARISNVQRLRQGGITGPVTLIRTPMLSQADEVVQFCQMSYNTEIAVIAALASAAIQKDKIHGIILMVEMGDGREGISPENVAEIAQEVMTMQGVALKGIGANFACLSGLAPTASQMASLCDLANEIEAVCGPFLKTVSGGNSANLPWAVGWRPNGRINDLRLGEAILLGVEPITGDQIGGMHTDAFTLVAEITETDKKPSPFPIAFVDPTLARLHIVPTSGAAKRLILAIGHQDTDISGLSLPVGCTLIGATSDHLVISSIRSHLQLGTEVKFQMNYSALMHAMAAPDIEIKLLDDRPARQPRHTQGKSERLTLV
ncbi:alanine/ornithine racemase family PLP-dependent enzyme [Sulfitobacter geojensis]|uniref:Alanine/ornithine racemase family PLP-dependent enzyme n=1 Tax=Sulfitobacter geojensis TaxID=1342299 RepID=A0AAE2W185_9RHOB|nr:alanine/ornithine racemase family PLP-dependent enzyme [Sulfitobacter geojensis]MBM1691137.1 alanine/ornithine racemase family PLP-dependent enzyme [Sulfitobacter geojensis]MBM1695203.1 alanine/ornithine racemase family PLP-dependent enzyme [Sulfitobacter geojensis]MBM1707303.1 alanine/ornithine racemase family PLP-dependent enzyme [Sulfitobacter geojensis]MBM1711453.1 alanine/ornithine racemase family PLP-dependent enzyme [Sulfitobacter geojensis]MBM1715428.1 alanine/ornithine racemase fam